MSTNQGPSNQSVEVTVLRASRLGSVPLAALLAVAAALFALSWLGGEDGPAGLATALIFAVPLIAGASLFVYYAVKRPPILTCRPEGVTLGDRTDVIPWAEVVDYRISRGGNRLHYLRIHLTPEASSKAIPLPGHPRPVEPPALPDNTWTVPPLVSGGLEAAQETLRRYHRQAGETVRGGSALPSNLPPGRTSGPSGLPARGRTLSASTVPEPNTEEGR